MEAILVSPAPAQQSFKSKGNNNPESGSESSFAPALDRAINEKESAHTSPTENSKTSRSSQADIHSNDEQRDLKASEETTGAYGNGQKPETADRPSGDKPSITSKNTVTAETDKTSAIIHSRISLFKDNGLSVDLPGKSEKTSIHNNQQSSASEIQPSKQGQKESIVSTQFTQILNDPLKATKAQPSNTLQQKADKSVFVQNNDTITWNEAKTASSDMLSQNKTFLQFTSAEDKTNATSSVRVERFIPLSELSSRSDSEVKNSILPLSAEKIAAQITEIPAQLNHIHAGLRDNVQSLRQDTHAQFIDAKLDHIDEKQIGQTEKQSLNSESDFSRDSSLNAASRNIDKSSDSSFSQTMQSASTDKPGAAVLDPIRPGNSLFTPQAQENHILHQVIHKFRISQHMQDSRLVMKLHPAELGDLKIDVQLKDGTISANILAQTSQVQQVLEKNMPRLKAIMEDQGLVVNEITIKLDTEVNDNRNMFEENLAKEEWSFAGGKDSTPFNRFVLPNEEIEEADVNVQPEQSGVNVMI